MVATLFWDVDTQHDFIDPDGKLKAPGAQSILPNLRKLTVYTETGLTHAGSVDAHAPRDPEFRVWPEHCVYGTPGQLKVDESTLDRPIYIPSRKLSANQLSEAIGSGAQLLFEKQHNDARTNHNATQFIERISPDLVVIYGVATDVCVDLAVRYMTDLGYRTIVVKDAIKEIYPEKAAQCLSDWEKMGVTLTSTAKLLRELHRY